ncbi:bifunctional 3-(3-hydroxy-phenyl)propionate/3-hydroxycinnamic acid hydroxylase [Nocardia otitidiscaviarum]|uniref:bifunctional 3-(3-hydroxy-phenyl)propionate/3-hydroxycinnamic acid hydroxylase MhpA n=1 Tax=Nocardia otitidiscaviarum TaxID=1823 RepID=UPI0009DE8312|nr:bifunctional 3-(3-hydroxy-phenyl)propionate/3-hydroxycinnamic acid hydroxylase [Nocardia otitidiscaviarum]MBF6133199.1 bifunctional 3-(3-hydroxy-phenyl)propionate/3-hydroxycinnamic acid hydroxylase [Nocardia otitidiscaviarum]MBF6486595.1 bifunctional 3-(3-hydroxy-phenyl)propionate/3-hydroxycinnamic acid hydroxylase [Nocardia otitidiscaviarum]
MTGLATVVPVVVVGAGPTGLTAATLLARDGIDVVVLERWDGLFPQPRAVHLDGEVRRILARLGIGTALDAITRPALGLRLVDREWRVLAQIDRDPAGGRNGYPEANLFDQPELEAALRANLADCSSVTLRGNIEVIGIAEEKDCVRVDYIDRVTGAAGVIRARYLLGCDGANSVVRTAVGARMRDLRFEQRWLVVDVVTAAELGQWGGVHQVCDPDRAATYMRIGQMRHRWEFRLRPGESAADWPDITHLHPIIRHWTANVPVTDLELVRVAEYTFRAQLADRWRCGRTFLLGDAAHLTPPFIGQGLCAGLRDAANLTWKLAAVLRGQLPDTVLDTYESERKPHARAMIRLAKLVGVIMTEGGEFGNRLRSLIAPRLHRVPGVAALIINGETPPLHRTDLVIAPLLRRGLAGRLIPNARLTDQRRVDDVIAGHYAVVTATAPSPAERQAFERHGVLLLFVRPGDDLHRWLRRGHTRAALVRPDGTVQRTGRDLAALCATIGGRGEPLRGRERRAVPGRPTGPRRASRSSMRC